MGGFIFAGLVLKLMTVSSNCIPARKLPFDISLFCIEVTNLFNFSDANVYPEYILPLLVSLGERFIIWNSLKNQLDGSTKIVSQLLFLPMKPVTEEHSLNSRELFNRCI